MTVDSQSNLFGGVDMTLLVAVMASHIYSNYVPLLCGGTLP